jgi:hypothetical protein
MTALNPPLHLQNRTDHTAQGDRLLIRSLWRIGGRAASGDCAVAAQGSPNMSVTVSAGALIIPGTENAFQGTYHCFNDASVTVTITAADTTNPRIDLIVGKVQDAFYSGATNAWSLVAVAGTPAGVPVAPAAPANSVILATVSVAANATTITNANITNTTALARLSLSQWQQVVAGQPYQWYNSAGALTAELDSTGHYKSFGTTGGAAKARPPMCRVEQTAFSVPNNAATKIAFAAAGLIFDTDAMFSDSNDWIVIQTAGIYRIRISVDFTWTNITGHRSIGLMVNGSFIQASDDRASSETSAVLADSRVVEVTRNCSPGDFFWISAYQNSGAALGLNSGPGLEGAVLEAYWLAPLS